jgi:hypothetical protein
VFKTLFAVCVLCGTLQCAAHAACSSDDAMNKGSDISDVLVAKVLANPDGTSKLLTELGDIMGNGTVTEQTCTKLDALALRAKKLKRQARTYRPAAGMTRGQHRRVDHSGGWYYRPAGSPAQRSSLDYRPVNAGITSRANQRNCSSNSAGDSPSAQWTMKSSSPGYLASTDLIPSITCPGVPQNHAF